jgi:aldose 1-epimerase
LVGGEPAFTLAQASRLAGTSGDPVSSAGIDPITLRSGPLAVVLSPLAGGAISRFWSEKTGPAVELFRRAPDAALGRRDPWGMGCFPLVPWSNRIRAGRFAFGGRTVSLPPNRPQDRHTIHGKAYTVTYRGSTVLKVEPHTSDPKKYVLYPDQSIEAGNTPLRKRTRFVADKPSSLGPF